MLTADEVIILSKMTARVLGDTSVVITDTEKEVAFESLKKMVDSRHDWTQAQKEQYKFIVDICKQYIR